MLWDWSNARAQDCSRGWSSACVYPGKADNFTVENLSIRERNFKGLPFLRSRVQLEKTHGWENLFLDDERRQFFKTGRSWKGWLRHHLLFPFFTRSRDACE